MKSIITAGLFTGVSCLLLANNPAAAQTWTPTTAPTTNWSSVCCSADGSRIAAAAKNGPVYLSSDSGVTWKVSGAPVADWNNVRCSANGKILAGVAGGVLLVSTNGGTSWNPAGIPEPIQPTIAIAPGGETFAVLSMKALDLVDQGPSYISTDTGSSWTPRAVPFRANHIVCSAFTTNLVLTAYGVLYISSNLGETWDGSRSPGALAFCTDPDVSFDASVLLAPGEPLRDYGLHVSTNGGRSWTTANLPAGLWKARAAADGSRLIAVGMHEAPPLFYTSSDAGASWVEGPRLPANTVTFCNSADATRVVAAVHGGGIYVLQQKPSFTLRIRPCGDTLTLSWLIPAVPCWLEQSLSPNSGTWDKVEADPTLNARTLSCEILLAPGSGPAFYRLHSPE